MLHWMCYTDDCCFARPIVQVISRITNRLANDESHEWVAPDFNGRPVARGHKSRFGQ